MNGFFIFGYLLIRTGQRATDEKETAAGGAGAAAAAAAATAAGALLRSRERVDVHQHRGN